MRIKIITLTVVIFCGCTGKKNNQNTAIAITDTIEQSVNNVTDDITDNDIMRVLHKKYQEYKIGYYNDLNCLGLGVVNPKKFDFKFITDTITGTGFYIDAIEYQEYLIPIIWKPDYRIFYMPVIHISNKYYEVQVNTETSVFVNKNDFDFYTWEELFTKRTLSIDAEKGYVKQDVKSESVIFDDDDIYLTVEKYEDDWLLVSETLEDGSKRDTYWVKWRDKNKLLVTPVFLM